MPTGAPYPVREGFGGARAAQVVGAMGRLVRRAAHRPPDARADVDAGAAVIVSGLGVALFWPGGALVGLLTWAVMRRRRSAQRRRLDFGLGAELIEASELLIVAVRSGLSLRFALEEAAPWLDGRLGEQLQRCLERAVAGWSLADELEWSRAVLGGGPEVSTFLAVLVGSERYGTSVAAGLDMLVRDLQAQHRRLARDAARQLPVRLLVPLVAGVLPAFVLLAVVPMLAGAVGRLNGGG